MSIMKTLSNLWEQTAFMNLEWGNYVMILVALDVSCQAVDYQLDERFGETREGRWLKRCAPLYGFILRYPKGKEHITGYGWEPWHIRYVTRSLALYLTLTGLTLEEYYEQK